MRRCSFDSLKLIFAYSFHRISKKLNSRKKLWKRSLDVGASLLLTSTLIDPLSISSFFCRLQVRTSLFLGILFSYHYDRVAQCIYIILQRIPPRDVSRGKWGGGGSRESQKGELGWGKMRCMGVNGAGESSAGMGNLGVFESVSWCRGGGESPGSSKPAQPADINK